MLPSLAAVECRDWLQLSTPLIPIAVAQAAAARRFGPTTAFVLGVNVASLLAELTSGSQTAISNGLPLPVAETPLPTFHDSLVAAQSNSGPLLNVPASDRSDTRPPTQAIEDEKKNQPAASWLLEAAGVSPSDVTSFSPQKTIQNPQTLQSPIATAVVANGDSTGKTAPSIAQQVISASFLLPSPGKSGQLTILTLARPSSSTTAVAGATTTINQKSPNGKRQAGFSTPALMADPAIAGIQSPIAVASTTANPPVSVSSVAVPTPATPAGWQGDDVAATYPVAIDANVTSLDSTPVAAVSTAAPTFVQTDSKTTAVAGVETPSATDPSLSVDTIAQRGTPGVTPETITKTSGDSSLHAPASDQRQVLNPQLAAQLASVPASPIGSALSTAHAGAAAEAAQKQVTPARPASSPVPPATQPMQSVPSPAVANTVGTPLVPLILQPFMPVFASAKTSAAPVSGKTSGSSVTNANALTSGINSSDAPAKTSVQAASETGAAQSDAQGASQQSDPSQTSPTSHSQSTAQSESTGVMQFVTVTDHVPANSVPAPAQPATGNSPHDARTAETAAPVSTPVHQVPQVNTAKLIQSVGQSEMRVGLRSTEFGNISIHTSATRDLVSAQISLDHDELAKTLATHLPEIQAKLGGSQPMEVRIDMNGQTAGQQPGQGQSAPGGTASGSREHPSHDQPAKTSAVSFSEVTQPRSSAGLANVGGAAADRRLDITV